MTTNNLSKDLVTGVILAGGKSSRMGGGDKFLKSVNNKPILELIVDRFSKQCETIIISANGDLDRLKSYNKPIVKDPLDNYAGPLAGILAAMQWSKKNKPEHTHILSVAADTPLFPMDYVEKLITHAHEVHPQSIILAKSRGWHHPIFGLWPVSLQQDLEIQLNNGLRKIRAWTETHPNDSLEFDDITINNSQIDPFFNINDQSDFDKFIQIMKHQD